MRFVLTSIRHNCLRCLEGWVREYFFAANGYEKEHGFLRSRRKNFVAPLPFLKMGDYPYSVWQVIPLSTMRT